MSLAPAWEDDYRVIKTLIDISGGIQTTLKAFEPKIASPQLSSMTFSPEVCKVS